MASPRAVDSWQEQGVHFFVFQLNPVEGAAAVPDDPPVVVFAMHPEEPAPVSVVVVTPKPGGEEAEVVDLRQAGSVYTAAYHGTSAAAQGFEAEREKGGSANERVPSATADHAIDTEMVNGHTPDVNLALLTSLQESQEFQTIQGRLATSLPTDSWQEDDAHFFVFQLLPADGSSPNGHEPPVAVFAMHWPEPAPISAVIVTPSADGEQAEVMDLRDPGSRYVAPIRG